MTDVREATETLLADKPGLESSLRDLLALDADGVWTFDDTGLDSGTFGEVVSRGIVEAADDGYRVADREAVRAALDDDMETESRPGLRARITTDGALPSINRRLVAALVVVLTVVGLVRVVPMLGSVFRADDVVLLGNDPYIYRYWAESLLAGDLSAFDLGALGALPGEVPTHDTILIVVVWWAAALLGGDPSTVGVVLAWYPPVVGVLTAALAYPLATRLTDDVRVGLASVLVLGVVPAHAYRTALGFGDHHAFDYLWVGLTLLSVVVLAGRRDHDRWVRHLAIVGVAGGVTVQTFAWRGGPLLTVPLGFAVAGLVPVLVGAGRSPGRTLRPLLLGLGTAVIATVGIHLGLGWAEPYRAVAPALLFVGVVAVVAIGELGRRFDRSMREVAGGVVSGGIVVVVAGIVILPGVSTAADRAVAYFVRTGQSGIAETYSLFSGELGTVLGPFFLFGFALLLAAPYVVWAVWSGVRETRVDRLVVGTYAIYFLCLSVVQLRFAGHLAVVTAPLAGLGFVHLAAWIELVDPPQPFAESSETTASRQSLESPERRSVGLLSVLFLLVGGPGVVQSVIKMSQLSIDEATYRTARWISADADDGAYVLSSWGRNRVYNYFVSGDSQSYWYARQQYEPFITGTDPDSWFGELADTTQYVVTQPLSGTFPDSTTQVTLQRRRGSFGDGTAGAGHFRQVYAYGDGDRRVFTVVRGATILGVADADDRVRIETDVQTAGDEFTYTRRPRANDAGRFGVTVPYPGTYRVGDRTVELSETAVLNGESVRLDEDVPNARWRFESSGDRVVDAIGDADGSLVDGTRTNDAAVGTRALSLDGGGHVDLGDRQVDLSGSEAFTVSAWVRPRGRGESDPQHILHLGRFEAFLLWRPDRGAWQAYFHNGDRPFSLSATGPDAVGEWTHVCARYDGETFEILIDGEPAVRSSATGAVRDRPGTDSIGSNGGRNGFFVGDVDDVRVSDTALSDAAIGLSAGSTTDE